MYSLSLIFTSLITEKNEDLAWNLIQLETQITANTCRCWAV